MEQDDDNHLCIRCGQTIFGLNNYISHRQHSCFKAVSSPLLSQGSDILTSADSNVASSDIYKLSADDFFLSLNLQNISHSSSSNQRSNGNDNYCSKLEFSTLDNDLESTFTYDKEMPEPLISDTSCMNMDRLLLSPEKLESMNSNSVYPLDENALCDISDTNSKSNNEISFVPSCTLDTVIKESQIVVPSIAMVSSPKVRGSQRQADSNTKCCSFNENDLVCFLCNFKFDFISSFLNHLLLCELKDSNKEEWLKEVIKYELFFVKSTLFVCNICSFYSNDKITFSEHLKTKIHCQRGAELKNPLLCLPCSEEYSSSDDIINHFSKNHLLEKVLHPIIVMERKKNAHCCHCLALVKGFILSVSNNNMSGIIDLTQLESVTQCAYGIEKDLLNSYLKLYKSLEKQKTVKNTVNSSFNNCFDKNIESRELLFSDFSNGDFAKKLTYLQIKKKSSKKSKLQEQLKVYFCCECETDYENKISFKNHLKLYHENSKDEAKCKKKKRLYLCETCGFVCKSAHGMTKHKRYHSGEKPFKCPHCDLSFAVSNSLLRHKRTHTGIKPYCCPYCSYTSNTQENLRKHILKTKKHAGRKMYPCKNCNYGSNEFSEYQSHMLKIHSEVCSDFKNIYVSHDTNNDL